MLLMSHIGLPMMHSKFVAGLLGGVQWNLIVFVLGLTRCQSVPGFSNRTVNESFDITQSVSLVDQRVVKTHEYDSNEDYGLDLTQEVPDSLKFGRVDILQEAKTLSSGLRQLSNTEMKVTAIQVPKCSSLHVKICIVLVLLFMSRVTFVRLQQYGNYMIASLLGDRLKLLKEWLVCISMTL